MRRTLIVLLVGLGASLGCASTVAQEHDAREGRERGGERRSRKADIEKLYRLVQEARADVAALRKKLGLGEEREGRGEHGRREGRDEHGRRGEGEEGGKRYARSETSDTVRKGARLILAFDPASRSFEGTVKNTTSRTLRAVRVEVHLSSGVELGPTRRVDLAPGEKVAVELSAAGQRFTWWTTHAEQRGARRSTGAASTAAGSRAPGRPTPLFDPS